MTAKACTKCVIEKPLDRFDRHPLGRYGRHPRCKDCRRRASPKFIEKSKIRKELGSEVWLCDKCETVKPLAKFNKNKSKPGGVNWCKECSISYSRLPENVKRASNWHRQRNYGVSEDKLNEMLVLQGWACPICQNTISSETACIDHDHRCCGKSKACQLCVRGLLCRKCNMGLGIFMDSQENLERARQYLARRP